MIAAFSGLLCALLILGVMLFSGLPKIVDKDDYRPLLASTLYDRNGEVLGKLFKERRSLIPFEKIPFRIVRVFVAAEDARFFEHSGINYFAIIRAFIANIRAGKRVQGGSTITQQVAKTLLLSPEKTYIRKIKEALLAYHMESALSKETILFLYLNQIYFGSGAYGLVEAAQTYFRKKVEDLTMAEMALLAGLPKAPSRYSPLRNPKEAKRRQNYVLERMYEVKDITKEERDRAKQEKVKIYLKDSYAHEALFFIEAIRQQLIIEMGEAQVLEGGLNIYTGLDLKLQKAARKALRHGLRQVDKRQGYRGPLTNLSGEEKMKDFLIKTKQKFIQEYAEYMLIHENGQAQYDLTLTLHSSQSSPSRSHSPHKEGPLGFHENPFLDLNEVDSESRGIPPYLKKGDVLKGIVTHVSDKWGLVTVRIPDGWGLIDVETMEWATPFKTNKKRREDKKVKKPSEVLKVGDVVEVAVHGNTFYSQRIARLLKEKYGNKSKPPADLTDLSRYGALLLEQEPAVEGSLLSFDQKTEEIVAMVGGYDFNRSQFNRTFQAIRQTGSSFKAIVYAAAIEKGYTAITPIIDAPIVFEEKMKDKDRNKNKKTTGKGKEMLHRWRPTNYSRRFTGEVFFRDALIRSLNVPTIKIATDIGLNWIAHYARRLGVFHPLNMDLTLSLGSSGITLYEMTKAFSQFGRMGQRIRPLLVHKVIEEGTSSLSQKENPVDENTAHAQNKKRNAARSAKKASSEGALDSESMESVGSVESIPLLGALSLDKRFAVELEKIEQELLDREARKLESSNAQNPNGSSNLSAGDNDEGGIGKGLGKDSMDSASTGKAGKASKGHQTGEPDPLSEDQIIKATTAFLITNLLESVVSDPYGTGGRARALNRPVAGKTGTTNGYHDAWFIGYTPQIATGVWVGFDAEKSLGYGETGSRAALPIWINYMLNAHQKLPKVSFPVPNKILFANIDKDTGQLASLQTKQVIRQAFLEGSEPKVNPSDKANDTSFYKQDYDE